MVNIGAASGVWRGLMLVGWVGGRNLIEREIAEPSSNSGQDCYIHFPHKYPWEK